MFSRILEVGIWYDAVLDFIAADGAKILIRGCMEWCNASPPHTERSIKHEWFQTALCRRAGGWRV